MNDEVAARVIAILASVKRVAPETVSPSATLEELGIDSLDRVNILFELEGEFNVDIPDAEARKITTVAEIIEKMRSIAPQQSSGV
jgi:acyl carrier protein